MNRSSILNLILSIFLTVIASASYATDSDGGSNGGGGNSTPRTPVSKDDLAHIINLARKLSRANFMYIENNAFGEMGTFQPVVEKMKRTLQDKPNLFSSVRLFVSQTNTCPKINGKTTVADYIDGKVCFNLGLLDSFKYNHAEAEIKVTALYLHEMAHASGYTNSPQDEQLLARFQDAVEKELVSAEFTQKDYALKLRNPLAPPPFDVEASTREKLQRIVQAPPKTSKMWLCIKLQAVTEILSDVPISNRQESHGISIMSSEDESLVDLLTWESVINLSLNCDGLEEYAPNSSHIAYSKKPNMTLREAISFTNGSDFCDPYYGPRVCKIARETMISTKPMSQAELKAWSVQFSSKVIRFFDGPQFKF